MVSPNVHKIMTVPLLFSKCYSSILKVPQTDTRVVEAETVVERALAICGFSGNKFINYNSIRQCECHYSHDKTNRRNINGTLFKRLATENRRDALW